MFFNYGDMYRNCSMDFIARKRLEMIMSVENIGFKPTARLFGTDKKLVKFWYMRYINEGEDGLKNRSRKPKTSPRRIPKKISDKIISTTIDAKENGKYITVNNIRRKIKLFKYSNSTINRYINKALNNIKDKKKTIATGGSVEWKKYLLPFEIIQIDIKYLTDIDNLKPYFHEDSRYSLPKYQITARDVLTGFPLVAYCPEKALCYTTMFLEKVLTPFLYQFKYLDIKTVKIQTDNGSEFTNKLVNPDSKDSSFTIFINNHFKKHKTIIPGHCTAQSDVETFHWSIERDCLAWDDIVDNDSLINYVNEYINTYVHSVISTRGYSPYEKIKETLHVQKVKVPKAIVLTIREQ